MEDTYVESVLRVGIGVMIFKNGKVLLGPRLGSHGAGEYSFPGGHLEYGETYEDCARRETLEEAGIEITNINFVYTANVMRYYPKHYVHIGLRADWASGEPIVKEPDKCGGWGWYDLDALPERLFLMCELSFEALRTKKQYFDGW